MHRLPRLPKPRRIASVMLIVWLSGMFTSWAHACLVTAPGALAHAAEHHAPPSGHERPAEAAADVAEVAGDMSLPPNVALALCEDFCETERSIIPQVQAKKASADTCAAMMPNATIGIASAGFALRRTGLRWHPLAVPPPPGPPVAIVLLRLTR
jgi:hypothetical protein